jgi:hypothetical protein
LKEPAFGTFSTLSIDRTAYLYGHAWNSTEVMLAKVGIDQVLDRSKYKYWDGHKFQSDVARCKPVIENMQHGAIYRSKLFEPGTKREYVFVGCSRFRDNKVAFGASHQPEGPFEMVQLMDTYPLRTMPPGHYMHYVYPHPWAFSEEDGQLMITWSEGGVTGDVIAYKVTFAQGLNTMPEKNTSTELAKQKLGQLHHHVMRTVEKVGLRRK